jgi:hypothetical protein
MKYFVVTLVVACLLFIGKTTVSAADQINLYFFFSLGCPHCAKETKFLNTQIEPLEDVVIHAFEVSQNQDNARLFSQVGNALGMSSSGVPVTIIGDWYTVGYGDDQTSGTQLLAAIDAARASGDPDLVGQIINTPAQPVAPVIPSPTPAVKPLLPSIGNLDLDKLSLPLLTVVIAAVDGFNPCAMWVLLFLISMLLGMQNRLKMWILGSVFILTSGVVYYFFLAAWLNVFLFIGVVHWIRLIIGLIALAAGLFQLHSFFTDKSGGCNIVDSTKRQKIFARIKSVTTGKYFALSILGMIGLAISVNMIELVCSAGLPAVYTQVLSFNQLPTWQYYAYLGLYTLIFMLDDLAVFILAMISLQAMGIQSKYARFSKLIGGSIILIIGLLMLFKPEWLMFG